MNLFNMINMNDEQREHQALHNSDRVINKKDFGINVYEAMEYNKHKQNETSFAFKMEVLRSFVR